MNIKQLMPLYALSALSFLGLLMIFTTQSKMGKQQVESNQMLDSKMTEQIEGLNASFRGQLEQLASAQEKDRRDITQRYDDLFYNYEQLVKDFGLHDTSITDFHGRVIEELNASRTEMERIQNDAFSESRLLRELWALQGELENAMIELSYRLSRLESDRHAESNEKTAEGSDELPGEKSLVDGSE